MKSKTRAVVIGGGVVGVSTLYHLARKGWDDVVLFERNDLTSGSTWHAAGLLPLFNMSYSVGQVHKYSVKLYGELEAETGLNAGLSTVGNIRLAMTEARMDEYRQYAAVAATIGVLIILQDIGKKMASNIALEMHKAGDHVAANGQPYPRMQLLAIADILAGTRFNTPRPAGAAPNRKLTF